MLALSESLEIFEHFLLQMCEQSVPKRLSNSRTASGRLIGGGGVQSTDFSTLKVRGGLSGYLYIP